MVQRKIISCLLSFLLLIAAAGPSFAGGVIGGNARVRASARRAFLGETNFTLDQLGKMELKLAIPDGAHSPLELPTPLSAEGSLLLMTAIAASPGSEEEHAARRVLLEYITRPKIRGEVESFLGAGYPVTRLKRMGERINAMEPKEKRLLLSGLGRLRNNLYTESSQRVSLAVMRANLSRFFDDAGEASASEAVDGRSSLVFVKQAQPHGKAATRIFSVLNKDEETSSQVEIKDSDLGLGLLWITRELHLRHIDRPSIARLLLALTRKPHDPGAKPYAKGEGPSRRRSATQALAKEISELVRRVGDEAMNAASAVATHFISHQIVPIRDEQDYVDLYKSIAAETGDRFTSFIAPDEMGKIKRELAGKYVGIGVAIGTKSQDFIKILASYPDGPAARAGIRVNDRIIKIDGVRYTSPEDAYGIKGKAGSAVMITLERGEGPTLETVEVEVERGELPARAPASARIVPGHAAVGYLNIYEFNSLTLEAVHKAMEFLRDQGMRSLIIDVRTNPGGLLESVERIAAMFLKKRSVVAWKDEGEGEIPLYTVSRDGEYSNVPIVVLADRGSASAAEIFVAALKEHGRAWIVGEQTFGKGIGQVHTKFGYFGREAILNLTTFRWFTPLHHWVQRLSSVAEERDGGVVPHEAFEINDQERRQALNNIAFLRAAPELWNPAKDVWFLRALERAEKQARDSLPNDR
ncbi:MAG: hypothetical protein COB53_02655 [Elusimicrobia bacterium]|nr:MAG: hypothetical protein COB53_02655 [Elusimicrobiota bacterium]